MGQENEARHQEAGPGALRRAEARSALAPVRRESLPVRVHARIREAMMAGAFRPGEALSLRFLAEAFDTSPMPVREALNRLVGEGALQALPNRSIAVPHLGREKLEEITRIRTVLEGMAAELAAVRIEAAGVAALEALDAEMAAALRDGQADLYLRRNQEFHMRIYRAASSETLLQLIEMLWLRIGPTLNYVVEAGDVATAARDHHAAILAALRSGDSGAAGRAVAEDITHGAAFLAGRLPESP